MKYSILQLTLPVYIFILSCTGKSQNSGTAEDSTTSAKDSLQTKRDSVPPQQATIDSAAYRRLTNYLSKGDTTGRWPVKDPIPVAGAVLPFNRVVAYYGNLYSNRMGALGKWPKKK